MNNDENKTALSKNVFISKTVKSVINFIQIATFSTVLTNSKTEGKKL